MVDWNDIAERCNMAPRPHHVLDVLIAQTAFPDIGECTHHCMGDEPIFWRDPYHKMPCPKFTESRDAISELIERVLPGWAYKMGTCCVSDDAWLCPDLNDPVHGPRLMQQFGPITQGGVFDCGFDIDRRPSGNMALAMCEAFCRAMAAVAEKDATK